MAYFGRRPKKPGSVPGSQSGFVQERRQERVERAVLRFVTQSRPSRQQRPSRARRAVRAARTERRGR